MLPRPYQADIELFVRGGLVILRKIERSHYNVWQRRPVLTRAEKLALVGGMLPLALGTGPSAEERRAIAIVVIGGQTLSLVLTLIVVPVVFYLVEAARDRLAAARAAESPAHAPV